MPQIRLTIGAKLDPSATHIFDGLIAASERAKKKITADSKAAAKEFVGGYRTSGREAEKAIDGVASAAEKSDKKVIASADKRSKQQIAFEKNVRKEHEANYRFYEAQDQKAANRRQQLSEANRRSVVGGTISGTIGMARGALGIAGSIARGVGVNMDPSALMGKVANQQASAVNISNAGFVENEKGSAGVRQDPAAIMAEARKASTVAKMDTGDTLAGLQAFTDKTTDLETGRALLERMAILSKSTGSNMEDVMTAAGAISVKLGDVPNKAEAVATLMAVIAKQGKIGSVAMSTMSSQIAGFIGPANQFANGPAKAIAEMGAVFQVTNKSGYAKGGAQSTTYATRFASDFTSAPGLKALHKAGIKDDAIFADKGHTKLNSMRDLLPMLLNKAGGDLTKIAAEMPNKGSGAVLKAFNAVWADAEKKAKGSGGAAVRAKFDEYSGGTSAADTKAALDAANSTTVSKVQALNNELERVAEEASAKILPSLEKLAPSLVSVAGGLGSMAAYVAQNPMQSLILGMSASFAKEIAGAGMKSMLSSALSSNMGGALGGVLAGAAITFAVTEAYFTLKNKARDDTEDTGIAGRNAAAEVNIGAKTGTLTQEKLNVEAQKELELQARITKASGKEDPITGASGLSGIGMKIGSGLANFVTAGEYGTSFSAQSQNTADREGIATLKADLAAMRASTDNVHKQLASGTMKVMQMNLPPSGPGAGTTGPVPVR